ncbi:DUF2752 domain-containing protein [Planomonospora sp. ID91781]|uniref:Membrane protein n=1 Tax=Planomonospora sphaerica TaxID=161355 RepID=A0A171B843_9ACTN|nr:MULTISPECIES: DUF2752 domain-containing protein [Planomonospora]MBG0822111.1 DUF2752 domain-containing protein [Planomonospora sp. ID91781]GAT64765.1 membrane protein [Planomonospora sphaerica]
MTEETAGARRSGARALAAPLGVALAAGAAVALVGAVDPNEPGHYPACPFLTLTGLYCPGCGGLRAVHALAHGDPAAALGLNPLLVAAAPLLAVLWARWAVRSWRGLPFDAAGLRPVHAWWLLGVMIVFWIGRNLPFGDFLAP